MSVLPDTAAAENQVIRIPDAAGGTIEFQGSLLDEVTTQVGRNPRWTELSLYRVTDGTNRYVLHSCGASVVYHKHQGPCNTGLPTLAQDMPGDAEPCRFCRPLRVPEDEDEFSLLIQEKMLWDMEMDRHKVFVCKDAREVVENLKFPLTVKILGGTLSAPAERLLEKVSPLDSSIAAVLRGVQRI